MKNMDEDMMDDAEEMDEEGSISEDDLRQIHKASMDILPEDFAPLSAKVPVSAEDGQKVALIVTGTAQGGKLADASVAEINLGEPEPKKAGKLNKLFSKEEKS